MISILSLLLIPIWSFLRTKTVDVLNPKTLLVLEGLFGIIILVGFNLYLHQDLNLVWTDQIIGARWGLEVGIFETALSGTLFLLFLKPESLTINLKNIILGLCFFFAFSAPSFLQFLVGALLFSGLIAENRKETRLIYSNIFLFAILEIVRVSLTQQLQVNVAEFVTVSQIIITVIILSYLLRELKKYQGQVYHSSIGLVLATIFFKSFAGDMPQGPLLESTLTLLLIISFIYLSFKAFLINRPNTLEELIAEAAFILFLFSLRFSTLPLFAIYLGGQVLFYHVYSSIKSLETTRLRQLSTLALKLFLVGLPGSIFYLSSISFVGFIHTDSLELGLIFLTLIGLRIAFNCAHMIHEDNHLLAKKEWIRTDLWLLLVLIILYFFSFTIIPNTFITSVIGHTNYAELLKLEDLSLGFDIYYLVLVVIATIGFYLLMKNTAIKKTSSKKMFTTVFDNFPDSLLSSEEGLFLFSASVVGRVKNGIGLLVESARSLFIFSMTEGLWMYESSSRLKLKLAIVLVFSAIISTLYLLRVL